MAGWEQKGKPYSWGLETPLLWKKACSTGQPLPKNFSLKERDQECKAAVWDLFFDHSSPHPPSEDSHWWEALHDSIPECGKPSATGAVSVDTWCHTQERAPIVQCLWESLGHWASWLYISEFILERSPWCSRWGKAFADIAHPLPARESILEKVLTYRLNQPEEAFSQKSILTRHQLIHTGRARMNVMNRKHMGVYHWSLSKAMLERPGYQCSEVWEAFFGRSSPDSAPEDSHWRQAMPNAANGKAFSQRCRLTRHQKFTPGREAV